jgi:hypothetical protein
MHTTVLLCLSLAASCFMQTASFFVLPAARVQQHAKHVLSSRRSHHTRSRLWGELDNEGEYERPPETPSEEEVAATKDFYTELKARGSLEESPDTLSDDALYNELNKRREYLMESQLQTELQVSCNTQKSNRATDNTAGSITLSN